MKRSSSIGATLFFAGIAAVMPTLPVRAQFHPSAVRGLVAGWVGSAPIAATEAFQTNPDGPTADHSRFDAVLARVVTDDAMVDYERLRADPADLEAYIKQLASVDFDALGRDEKLALLINAYNAFTLRLILDHWPVASIMDIPEAQRWDARRWKIGDHTLSLNQIEHDWLRGKFVEPRIHFAINCASVGCPPLLDEAYVGDRIDEQLDKAARIVHRDGSRWFDFDPGKGRVRLTKLYDWYGDDFRQVADSPLDFAARYAPKLRAALDAGRRPRIEWIPYDWSLNTSGAATK